MNKAIFIGNITKDAEVKQSREGKQYAMFGIAVNNKKGEENKPIYISCFHMGKFDGIFPYLKKGAKIAVEGRISVSAYLDKNNQPQPSLNLLVSTLELCGDGHKPQQTAQNPFHPSDNNAEQQRHMATSPVYQPQPEQSSQSYDLPF